MLNTRTFFAGQRQVASTRTGHLSSFGEERLNYQQNNAVESQARVSATVKPMSRATSNADFESWSEWNPATFDRVISQYQTRIYRFIYSIVGESELAHDLTQDTFLSAYRNLLRRADSLGVESAEEAESFAQWQNSQSQNNMSAWLYTIARNAALSEMRRRKIVRFLPFLHKPVTGTDEELDSLSDSPLIEAGGNLEARTALRDELQQAMDKVGREKLTALLLHMDGFSYKEICDITGDSLSSVKSQIFRAKESLRRALTGFASPVIEDLGGGQY
ncbi:MAG TPA: RNA polymerase sigma factor [Chloroflexia bacterium]|nr:RNA polymerase sigma factor [Chloroflexia bacterium]